MSNHSYLSTSAHPHPPNLSLQDLSVRIKAKVAEEVVDYIDL
jgi:hypothetical protein